MKKIKGIKKVCSFTKRCHPDGLYLQVALNWATGELYSHYHTPESYTDWGKGFFAVANYYHYTPMKEVKKDVAWVCEYADWYTNYHERKEEK